MASRMLLFSAPSVKDTVYSHKWYFRSTCAKLLLQTLNISVNEKMFR